MPNLVCEYAFVTSCRKISRSTKANRARRIFYDHHPDRFLPGQVEDRCGSCWFSFNPLVPSIRAATPTHRCSVAKSGNRPKSVAPCCFSVETRAKRTPRVPWPHEAYPRHEGMQVRHAIADCSRCGSESESLRIPLCASPQCASRSAWPLCRTAQSDQPYSAHLQISYDPL